MPFDYFYGPQADMFSFYRVPKVLFTDERFKDLSTEAKTLYGILLDRVSLSVKNGWIDDAGRVYIIYTINEIEDALGHGNKKSGKLLKELDKIGLIDRKRQGLNKPNLIYVKNFMSGQNGHFLKCPEDISRDVQTTFPEVSNGHATNTDKNNTDNNDTDPSFLSAGSEQKRKYAYGEYYSFFREQLEIDILTHDTPEDAEQYEELLQLIVDTYCSSQRNIRIGRDTKPIEVVRSQFMKLNAEHIRFVLLGMQENTTQIRNIRQYLLSALYNAPMTMSGYYAARVNHDLAAEKENKMDLYDYSIPYELGTLL